MTAITLPPDLLAWARAEVAAGRAESVAALVEARLRASRQWEELRHSLDVAEAEADAGGWSPFEDVFARLKARFPAG